MELDQQNHQRKRMNDAQKLNLHDMPIHEIEKLKAKLEN